MTQVTTLLGSAAALPSWKSGSLNWKPQLQPAADDLRRQLGAVAPDQFGHAVHREGLRRMDGFLRGIEAYRRHSYRRALPAVPVVWEEGSTRLLDYGDAGGRPVLVIPSLVNRAYILDLTAKRSLMRHLATAGLRPFLVDWGGPGPVETDFSLEDYIAGRLVGALDHVLAVAGPPVLLGYCMGGLLALGLGVLRQDAVRGLALLATPWDFHRPTPLHGQLMGALKQPLDDVIRLNGEAPVDMLQAMFAMIDPGGIERKFRSFGLLKGDSAKARDFVAVEDWLNDGVPLVARVARETLFGWYIDNQPAKQEWRLGETVVRPESFAKPALAMVPAKDRIVPPASALALADALPRCRQQLVKSGHIGMVTGASAKTEVYRTLTDWLNHKDMY